MFSRYQPFPPKSVWEVCIEILDITSSGSLELSSGFIHMSYLTLLDDTLRWAIPGRNHQTLIGILLELCMEPL